MSIHSLAVGLAMMISAAAGAQSTAAPLELEARIPLGAVSGRIDHLAVDLKRQRLSVAELGNDTIGVVNLAARKMQRTMLGYKEPQGIAYEPSTDALYVANGGDGSVRILRADDLTLLQRIDLGQDADNVRVDVARKRVLVGYGKGALALIDPSSRKKKGRRHPTSGAPGEFPNRRERQSGLRQRAGRQSDSRGRFR
jgi:DNA-binding beta-propeller fold protein YncE